MSVCIDLSAAAHERAGLGRYAASLATALLPHLPGLRGFVNDARATRLRPPLDALVAHTAGLPRKRWRLRAAASYFGAPGLDRLFPGVSLFHATEHLLPRLDSARSVFTLHDTAYLRFPQYHLLQNRLYLSLMMPHFLRRANAVIAVSHATRRDAERYYRLDPARLHVIPEGVDAQFRPVEDPTALAAVRQRYALPERYILCVGTLEPRKNLDTLIAAYAALRAGDRHAGAGLVLAGGKGWLYAGIFERLRQLGLDQIVGLPGFVPEADLPALLAGASVFAFPSVFEGFGLPPLEAMACGVPVVCSNAASLPEVVGEAGLLLPPDRPEAWADALARLLADADLRADLSARGLARAKRFTWEAAAQQTLKVYASVLEERGPRARRV